jgi:uncharacterized protein (DUF2062 family)
VKAQLKRWLPNPDTIRKARWVRWFGPMLHHPRLWHPSRRGISLGFALGIFLGLLIPVGQMPLAAGAAVLLRANVPIAMASTFVSNPVTFGPLYYLAYQLGVLLVGEDESAPLPPGLDERGAWPDPVQIAAPLENAEQLGFFAASWTRIESMGKPLLVGLSVIAVSGGLLAHVLVNLVWRLSARMAWRRRVRERRKRQALAEAAQLDMESPAGAVAEHQRDLPR